MIKKHKLTAPKFEIGATVTHMQDESGRTVGVVVDIEKIFLECYPTGSFNYNGQTILESHIKDLAVPYVFQDNILILNPNTENERIFQFNDYAYTVENDKTVGLYNGLKLHRL